MSASWCGAATGPPLSRSKWNSASRSLFAGVICSCRSGKTGGGAVQRQPPFFVATARGALAGDISGINWCPSGKSGWKQMQFPDRKRGFFCSGQETKGLRGGILEYVAQASPQVDTAKATILLHRIGQQGLPARVRPADESKKTVSGWKPAGILESIAHLYNPAQEGKTREWSEENAAVPRA